MFKEHRYDHHSKRSQHNHARRGGFEPLREKEGTDDANSVEEQNAMRGKRQHMRFADGRGGRHQGSRGGRPGGNGGHQDRPSFLRGRKFGANELQLLLLSLLKEQASYGYELIKTLTEKSGGFYTPSPGVVYPALSYMEDVGYITVQQEGTRKRYAISALGEAHLLENKTVTDILLEKLALFASHSDSVSQAMREQRQPFIPALNDALQELRHEMRQHPNSDAETQQQIAVILQQATKQIKAIKG